jgi:hypothetical protein
VAERLRGAGIAAISTAGICSLSVQNDFFSYRRARMRGQADYGRQISAIVLT